MCNSPPNNLTVISSSVKPFSTHATAVAQHPVPQARVSPVPLSQTRMNTFFRSRISTNSVFVRFGKQEWFSNFGPIFSMARSFTPFINTMAWGLPMETQVIRYSSPSTVIGASTTAGPTEVCCVASAITGTSIGARTGCPMFTCTIVTCPLSVAVLPSTVSFKYFILPALTMVMSSRSVSPLS